MDYTLVGLLALIAATVVISTRLHKRSWPGRPGYQYQRVFSVGAFGLWLTIAGLIGWDVSHVHGFFQGTKWVDGLIWWQIAFGAALLTLAVFLARRVPTPASRQTRNGSQAPATTKAAQ
jgi:hypothetical protein